MPFVLPTTTQHMFLVGAEAKEAKLSTNFPLHPITGTRGVAKCPRLERFLRAWCLVSSFQCSVSTEGVWCLVPSTQCLPGAWCPVTRPEVLSTQCLPSAWCPVTRPEVLSAWFLVSGVQWPVSNSVWCLVSGAQSPVSNASVWYLVPNVWCAMSGVWCLASGARE